MKEKYNYIIYNKEKCIREKNYDEACEWRTKEINFMMDNFGIDIRSQFRKNLENGISTNIMGIVKE